MPTSRSGSPLSQPRWTEQIARAALAALEQSGMSVRVFSEEHGLDPQRLYSWRRRLGEAERTTFQEMVLRHPSSMSATDSSDAAFEVVLPGGVVVRVPPRFDVTAFEHLLAVLARLRAC